MFEKNIKSPADIKYIANKIKEKFNPLKVILFGSRALETFTKDSDIDLLIVMNTDLPVRQQAFIIRREILSIIPVDIIVRTPAQIEDRIKMGDMFIKKAYEKCVEL